jgi:hypothetical protein
MVSKGTGAANITTVRENFKAAGGWLSRGPSKVPGVRCPSAKDCAEQRKNSVYPIGEEKVSVLKNSVQKSQKFGLIKWAHDGTRIHVGMSKRWTCTTVRLEVGAPSRRCPE